MEGHALVGTSAVISMGTLAEDTSPLITCEATTKVRSRSNTSDFKFFCSGIHRGCRAINVRSETVIIVGKNNLYLV